MQTKQTYIPPRLKAILADTEGLAGLPAVISDPTVGAKNVQFYDDSEPAESPATDAITISTAQHRSVWDE